MSASTSPLLTDFMVYELPPEKWWQLISPKMRLRVRGNRREFVSSVVKVNNRKPDTETDIACTHWPWDERFSRPSFSDDEAFEIAIERRFLLGYKCIRRTKPVTIDEVPTDDHSRCMLSLYDGQYCTGALEDKVKIGKLTFMLVVERSQATG